MSDPSDTLAPVAAPERAPRERPLAVPLGRPADRMAAGVAGLALLGALGLTAWFFLGFVENDPELRASSSALLLSLGLGAFAVVPSAVVLRLAWGAWRRGFRRSDGLWTLLLASPWLALAGLMAVRAPVPVVAPVIAFALAALLCLWAGISLALDRRARRRGAGTPPPPET